MEPHQLRKAVDSLREAADEHTYARIMFGPTAQRPRAREVADLFELAGWRYRFSDIAQETMHGYPYREGIEVIGLNGQLVTIIAGALSQAGMTKVRQIVKPNTIDPSNPKYAYVVREIEVHVGHLPAEAAQTRRQSPEGSSTKITSEGAVVAAKIGLIATLLAALIVGAATVLAALINGEPSRTPASPSLSVESMPAEAKPPQQVCVTCPLERNSVAVSATSTALATSPASTVFQGTAVSLTATVSPVTADGTVQFKDGAINIGDPVTVRNGIASGATESLTVGSHQLTVVFTPTSSTAYGSSTSPTVILVVRLPPG